MFGLFTSHKRYTRYNLPVELRSDLVDWNREMKSRRLTKPKFYTTKKNTLGLSSGADDTGARVSFLELETPNFDQVSNFFRVASLMKELSKERSILGVDGIVCDAAISAYAIITDELQYTLQESLKAKFLNIAGYNPVRWIWNLVDGLKYIHQTGLTHGDFSSENIWVARSRSSTAEWLGLKIGGFSYKYAADITLPPAPQSVNKLLAPETITQGIYSTKSDIFHLGILLWEIISTEEAWLKIATSIGATSDVALFKQYKHYFTHNSLESILPIPADAPAGIAKLIRQCWLVEVEKRPTAAAIVKYLDSIYYAV